VPRENTIVGACTRELDRRGAWWINIHGAGIGRNGIPDLLFCHLGYFGALETKSRTGTPSKLQLWELERINRAGGIGIVARTIEQLRQVLDTIETRHRANQPSERDPGEPA
jgi:hypothetical protein